MAKRSVPKGPRCCPHNGKTLSVQRCTLYALDNRHLVFAVEEAEPGRGDQIEIIFLNGYRDDSACSGAILQDCRILTVKK